MNSFEQVWENGFYNLFGLVSMGGGRMVYEPNEHVPTSSV